MKAFTTATSLAVVLMALGCGGKSAEPGDGAGKGGGAGTGGTAGASAGTTATGGSATGGSATGGSATGGSTTGGTGGSNSGAGGTAAGAAGAACKVDSDCPVSKVACRVCADGSNACPWARCEAGQCLSGIDTCPSTECKVDGDCPISMATCQLCDDGSSACPWAHCDAGKCTAGIDTCPTPVDPCAGKACGDTCTTCTGTQGCLAVVMFCDANLSCGVTEPECGTTSCKLDADCGAGMACVEQVGGVAGPGGVHCAKQNPCGSALRCGCIVGEGTCTYVAGDPGYCQCDNGIR